MYILIVEDDPAQFAYFKEILIDSFPNLRLNRIITEKDFRDKMKEIANDRPDVILMDIMLRWTDPAPDMSPPPKEVEKEGFFRAGLRCVNLLAQNNSTKRIPIILYSVLELKETVFPSGLRIKLLGKDFARNRLKEAIREMTR